MPIAIEVPDQPEVHQLIGELDAYLLWRYGFLEQKAAQLGYRRFLLETGPDNPEARGLYQPMGYRRCGACGDYPEHPLSVFMEKRVESCVGG
jgi:hypothetical protein